MATTNIAFSSVTTLTTTNLQSLASSATAGWQSDVQTNSVTLYLDALVMVVLDFANTAAANDKAAYLYAYGGIDATHYTNPVTGTEGTLTLPNVTSNPLSLKLLAAIPYVTQDEVVEAGPFSVALAFGGILPVRWGLALINFSGAALAASGNIVKWTGITATVA